MKQQLIQEQKLLKPSQILRQAYFNGVKKIEGEYHDGDAHCSIGLLYDDSKLRPISFGELSREKVTEIFAQVIVLNDQGPHITFLDCAEFLESKGL